MIRKIASHVLAGITTIFWIDAMDFHALDERVVAAGMAMVLLVATIMVAAGGEEGQG